MPHGSLLQPQYALQQSTTKILHEQQSSRQLSSSSYINVSSTGTTMLHVVLVQLLCERTALMYMQASMHEGREAHGAACI